MKVNKRLSIGEKDVELVSDDVILSENWPGKARFMVQSRDQLSGFVDFKAGYSQFERLVTVFKGIVDSCIEVSPGKWQVIAREYTGVLDMPVPLALRHVDLPAALAKISAVTGIRFSVPDRPYAQTKAPFFYNTGNGIQALEGIRKAFAIPDYIWQQQGDGKCFVGSFADSFWQDKKLNIAVRNTKKVDGRAMQIMLMPSIRPGITINGSRIKQIQHTGVQTTVRW